ncbi:hypothetical protein Q4F19_20010 [Sphingomonas sp. BIUV-7]|uniref:Secreted protein n=1 Tax=Sphingomonas natans TaxID=3063330 RepID=A0ABT8YEB3_9SPHN|nr:hypothetical protein [Sphingomonas sp. BIUV-7]MDO6416680.1 hypothetical protein [Sphingomonas sp. BIUV-7]
MLKPIIALAVALIATGAAAAPRPTGEARLQAMLAGRTAGTPTNCVSLAPSMDSTKIEGVGMVYRRGRTLYVNRFVNGCPSLNSFNGIVTRTPSTQLCRGDIARVVDFTTGIEGGSCVLGDFTPYEKAK